MLRARGLATLNMATTLPLALGAPVATLTGHPLGSYNFYVNQNNRLRHVFFVVPVPSCAATSPSVSRLLETELGARPALTCAL